VEYTDRTSSENYADDEPVVVSALGKQVRVPERLFLRLVCLASGYELHLLPVIDPYGDTSLTQVQCISLESELAFLLQRVSDEALEPHLLELHALVVACCHAQPGVALAIEGP
jgi:hypothetical protein